MRRLLQRLRRRRARAEHSPDDAVSFGLLTRLRGAGL